MLVVKLEIWPAGSETQAEELGRIYIGNDGSGDYMVASYTAFLTKLNGDKVRHRRRISLPVKSQIWRTVRIAEHVRAEGPWRLVQLVLDAALTRRTAATRVVDRGLPAGARRERFVAAASAVGDSAHPASVEQSSPQSPGPRRYPEKVAPLVARDIRQLRRSVANRETGSRRRRDRRGRTLGAKSTHASRQAVRGTPDSACTILRQGSPYEALLIIRAELDTFHYGIRGYGPGEMDAQTEEKIREQLENKRRASRPGDEPGDA